MTKATATLELRWPSIEPPPGLEPGTPVYKTGALPDKL